MRLTSIRARMTVAFALTISLLMLLACGGLIWYAQWAAERKATALLGAAMVKIQSDLADNAPRIDTSDLQDNARLSNMALLVVDAGGHTLFQSQRDVPPRPWKSDANWCVKVLPFRSNTVVLGLPWRGTQQALYYQALLLILLGVFVTIAATIGDWIVVGRTLSPIGALSRQAQAASAENLRLRLIPPSQDAEIVGLVSTLNELLARIAETVAAKGRFHAAASHELRTPLQVLSGQLELALHRQRSNDEYRQFIEEAGVYARRLVALARDLLLLHQLDAAQPPVTTEVDLADICSRALQWLESKTQERGLHVQTEWQRGALLEAAPSHAEMLVRNLLENAVKYATPNGSVTIHLGVLAGQMRLTVYNDCHKLPDGSPQEWLEPFYRADVQRNSHDGGTGLGLAICKAIADANGWVLELQREKEGVRATVRFCSNRQENPKGNED